jgi:hypothetical protein
VSDSAGAREYGTRVAKPEVARGIGPVPFRLGLAGLALVYYMMLLKHPTPQGWIRQIAYFSECTALFTQADPVATEYRLDGWSCERHDWEPLDPRPYFPIRADDKEARFQRIAHFYAHPPRHNREEIDRMRLVMNALDDYIVAHHGSMGDDGLAGAIGGIRLYQIERPIPELGTEIDRYEYRPLSPVPEGAKRFDLFHTTGTHRKARCGPASVIPASGSAAGSAAGSADNDPWASP